MTEPTNITSNTENDLNNLHLNFDDIETPINSKENLNINFENFSNSENNNTQINSPQLNTIESNDVQVNSPQLNTIESNDVQVNSPQLNTIESNDVQVNSPQLNTIESNDVQVNSPREDLSTINFGGIKQKNNDRLIKEDEITQKIEKNNDLENKNLFETQEKILNKKGPSFSFGEDQKIIEEITNSQTQNNENKMIFEEEKQINNEIISKTPKNTEKTKLNPENGTSMDLDTFLGIDNTQIIATKIEKNNAGSEFQTNMPIITIPKKENLSSITSGEDTGKTQTKQKIRYTNKNLKTLFIFLLLGGTIAYILATMYPLEYQNIKANILSLIEGKITSVNKNNIENILESSGEMTNGILLTTGTITTGTIINEGTGEKIENINENLSTSGFNGFTDLEEILTGENKNVSLTNQQLEELKKYSDQSKTFLALGQKTNNKIMIKYSLYIFKKANEFINNIENNKEIDNEKIQGYLAQFSGYLYKLTTLSNESSTGSNSELISQEIQNNGRNEMIEDINRENKNESKPIPEIPNLLSGENEIQQTQ